MKKVSDEKFIQNLVKSPDDYAKRLGWLTALMIVSFFIRTQLDQNLISKSFIKYLSRDDAPLVLNRNDLSKEASEMLIKLAIKAFKSDGRISYHDYAEFGAAGTSKNADGSGGSVNLGKGGNEAIGSFLNQNTATQLMYFLGRVNLEDAYIENDNLVITDYYDFSKTSGKSEQEIFAQMIKDLKELNIYYTIRGFASLPGNKGFVVTIEVPINSEQKAELQKDMYDFQTRKKESETPSNSPTNKDPSNIVN